MMRVFLLIGSRAKTPHPCSLDGLRAILGSLVGFGMRRASYTGTRHGSPGKNGCPGWAVTGLVFQPVREENTRRSRRGGVPSAKSIATSVLTQNTREQAHVTKRRPEPQSVPEERGNDSTRGRNSRNRRF